MIYFCYNTYIVPVSETIAYADLLCQWHCVPLKTSIIFVVDIQYFSVFNMFNALL